MLILSSIAVELKGKNTLVVERCSEICYIPVTFLKTGSYTHVFSGSLKFIQSALYRKIESVAAWGTKWLYLTKKDAASDSFSFSLIQLILIELSVFIPLLLPEQWTGKAEYISVNWFTGFKVLSINWSIFLLSFLEPQSLHSLFWYLSFNVFERFGVSSDI